LTGSSQDNIVQKPEGKETWVVGDGELDALIAGLGGETSKLAILVAGLVCGIIGGGAIAAGVLFALRCKPQRTGSKKVKDEDSLSAAPPRSKNPILLSSFCTYPETESG
jgi:hypothetical protein